MKKIPKMTKLSEVSDAQKWTNTKTAEAWRCQLPISPLAGAYAHHASPQPWTESGYTWILVETSKNIGSEELYTITFTAIGISVERKQGSYEIFKKRKQKYMKKKMYSLKD